MLYSALYLFAIGIGRPPTPTLFPYTTLFRSVAGGGGEELAEPRAHRITIPLHFSPKRAHVVEAHRSEEHTSELQSLRHLVCRLLLEKKKPRRSTPTRKGRKEYPHVPELLPSH